MSVIPRSHVVGLTQNPRPSGKIDLERQNSFASVSTLPVYEVSREASAQP